MNLNRMGVFEQRQLIQNMAIAIAKSNGFVYTGTDIIHNAQSNPRTAQYVRAAYAALDEIQKFGR